MEKMPLLIGHRNSYSLKVDKTHQNVSRETIVMGFNHETKMFHVKHSEYKNLVCYN